MSKALAKGKPLTYIQLIRTLKRIVAPFNVKATLDVDIIDNTSMRITFNGERKDGVKLFIEACTDIERSDHAAILDHFRNAVETAAKQE